MPECKREPTRAKLCDGHYDTRRDLAVRPEKATIEAEEVE